jgi:hypothetical protein
VRFVQSESRYPARNINSGAKSPKTSLTILLMRVQVPLFKLKSKSLSAHTE